MLKVRVRRLDLKTTITSWCNLLFLFFQDWNVNGFVSKPFGMDTTQVQRFTSLSSIYLVEHGVDLHFTRRSATTNKELHVHTYICFFSPQGTVLIQLLAYCNHFCDSISFWSWGLNGIKTNPKHNITIWSLGVRFVAEILQVVQGTHCRIKDLNVEAWLFGGALLRDNPDKNACHCRGVASTPWSLHYSNACSWRG